MQGRPWQEPGARPHVKSGKGQVGEGMWCGVVGSKAKGRQAKVLGAVGAGRAGKVK